METLDIKYYRRKYPNVPDHALPVKARKTKQSPANLLTDQVIRYIKSRGGAAYRINTTGNYNNQLGKWIMSGVKKGLPDIIGILHGRFIGIEIKIGRDKQSEDQKQRQKEIEATGGLYLIVRNFKEFENEFVNSLIIR